jgi:four helix bundle protein
MAPSRPAGPSHLVVFERWMETTRWIFERTQRFPKRLRHSLTERIERAALDVLEHLTAAAWRKSKEEILLRTDERLSQLRVLLRLAFELKVLSHGQYEEAAKRLSETGKMVGGWRKSRPSAS